jgi:hypothetical protein
MLGSEGDEEMLHMKARNEELYGLHQGYPTDSLRVAWSPQFGFVLFHPQKSLVNDFISLLKKVANSAGKNTKNSNQILGAIFLLISHYTK